MASKSSIEAGKAHVSLATDDSALKSGLKAAEAAVKGFAQNMMAVGGTLAAAGAAMMAPFLQGLSEFSDWGKEMTDGMRMTGIAFQELDTIMDGMRVSTDQLVPAVARMRLFLNEAGRSGSQAQRSLESLGMTMADLEGVDAGEQVLRLADALARAGDNGRRLQREIFGRGGLALNITGGREGIEARAARMDVVEGVQTPEQLAAAKEYTKTMKEMRQAIGGVFFQLGAVAAGPATTLLRIVTSSIITFREWVERNRELLGTIFRIGAALTALGTTFVAAGGAIIGTVYAYNVAVAIANALTGSWFALLTGGVVVVGALAVGFGALAVMLADTANNSRALGFALGSLTSILGDAFGGLVDAMAVGNFAAAWEIIKLGGIAAWEQITVSAQEMWINTITGMIVGVSNLAARMIEAFAMVQAYVRQMLNSIFGALGPQIAGMMGLNTMGALTSGAAAGARAVGTGAEANREAALAAIDRSGLDAATTELADAVTMAAMERGMADLLNATPDMARPIGPGVTGGPSGGSIGLGFGSQALGGMGIAFGESAAERAADAAEESRDLLERIEEGIAGLRDEVAPTVA